MELLPPLLPPVLLSEQHQLSDVASQCKSGQKPTSSFKSLCMLQIPYALSGREAHHLPHLTHKTHELRTYQFPPHKKNSSHCESLTKQVALSILHVSPCLVALYKHKIAVFSLTYTRHVSPTSLQFRYIFDVGVGMGQVQSFDVVVSPAQTMPFVIVMP